MKKHCPGTAWQVLLVEDEPAVRFELHELLEEEGYDVVEAANGLEALHALDQGFEPDIVVLDLMMPVMDGWEFLRCIKRRGSQVPVILTTAAEPEMVPLGIDRVRKPFCVEPLLAMLQQRCVGVTA